MQIKRCLFQLPFGKECNIRNNSVQQNFQISLETLIYQVYSKP